MRGYLLDMVKSTLIASLPHPPNTSTTKGMHDHPLRAHALVSSPDPDSQQLRVDYITATFPRSGDVIHPQLLGIWVWGRDYTCLIIS